MSTQGDYAPPESIVEDRHTSSGRLVRSIIAGASGVVSLSLLVVGLAAYTHSDTANLKWFRLAAAMAVPSLCAAASLLPFKRVPGWLAATAGMLLAPAFLVGLAFAAMEIESALGLHWI